MAKITGFNLSLSRFSQELKSTVKRVTQRVEKALTTPSKLERTPAHDSYVGNPIKEGAKYKSNCIGNMVVEKNRLLAKAYVGDLEKVAQEIPEVSFVQRFNTGSTKELPSILDKITNRSDLYEELGYSGVVRDGVRGMLFMPEAEKNYTKIVKAMEKRGYKVAKAPMVDSEGKVIYGANGKAKEIEDVEHQVVPSGYSAMQMRFSKGHKLYELLILPGPNYAECYKKEHTLVFERFRKYDAWGLTKDEGAKQIVKAIKKEFHSLTKRLYDEALQRDLYGALSVKDSKPVTFTKENITNLRKSFRELKKYYKDKFNSTSPNKRSAETFEQTKRFKDLDTLEKKLKQVMKIYEPID